MLCLTNLRLQTGKLFSKYRSASSQGILRPLSLE
jgi:hypothetical protein